MKIVNLIWGFSLGAGIDKCFMTYARLGDIDPSIQVNNVCINLLNLNSHIEPLNEINTTFINIASRKDFSWVNKLHKYILENQPDIIFTHGFNGAIMMLILRIFKGVKVKTVLTYHGRYQAPNKLKKPLEWVYNNLSIAAYRHISNMTICVAEYSRKYLKSKGVPEEKITTVHNGITDITSPTPINLDNTSINIITASRIDKIKGLNVLLDALSLLKNKGVKFHYYMVGEGPELEILKQQCSTLNLVDEVSFVGYQNNIPSWLVAADIFVIPSFYENHSIAILEAMRAGKAIIATKVGGNGESISHMNEGVLIQSHDSQALADALELLIADNSLRQKLALNARKRFINEFTEDAMKRNIANVLKSL